MGGNFVKNWKESPRIKFRGFKFRSATTDDVVNFELGTHGENFEKRWNALVSSLTWEAQASLTSQTQPTPVQITFRMLKTIHAGGGGGWVWLVRLCKRLLCLQRNLGGQYWRTSTMPTWEWQPCWSVCCGGCQEATFGSSTLSEEVGLLCVFAFSLFCSLPQSSHAGQLEGTCESRALSMRHK